MSKKHNRKRSTNGITRLRTGTPSGKPTPDAEKMLPTPSIEGAQAFIQKLKDWIEHVETYPGLKAASYSWQIAQVIPSKDGRGHATGAAEWHMKAIVIKPVPEDLRVEGREYACRFI